MNIKRSPICELKSEYYMNSSQSYDNNGKDACDWLTTSQVIQLLDISRGTLYRLESEGKLKPVEMPGNKILKHRRIRYSRVAVEKLMLDFNYDSSNRSI